MKRNSFGRSPLLKLWLAVSLMSFFSIEVNCSDNLRWITRSQAGLETIRLARSTPHIFTCGRFTEFTIKKWLIPSGSHTHTTFLPATFSRLRFDVSPDESTFLLGSGDIPYGSGDICAVDSTTGFVQWAFAQSQRAYLAPTISPNGTFGLYQAYKDQDDSPIIAKHLQSGATLQTFTWYGDRVNDICFASDSNTFVSGTSTRLRFWNVGSPFQLQSVLGETFCLDISEKNRYLVTGHTEGKVVLWDYALRIPIATWIVPNCFEVTDVKFDNENGTLVAAIKTSTFGYSRLVSWNIRTRRTVFNRLVEAESLKSLVIPKYDRSIYAVIEQIGLRRFFRLTGQMEQETLIPDPCGQFTVFGDGGSLLIHFERPTRSGLNLVASDSATGNFVWQRALVGESRAGPVTTSTGDLVAVGVDSTVQIRSSQSGDIISTVSHDENVGAMAFSPVAQLIAVVDKIPNGLGTPELHFYDLTTAQRVRRVTLPSPISNSYELEYSPDGTMLFLFTQQGNLLNIDTQTWQIVFNERMVSSNTGSGISVSPNNQFIALGHSDVNGYSTRVYDTTSMEMIAKIDGVFPFAVSFLEDNATILVSDNDIVAYDIFAGSQVFQSSHRDLNYLTRIQVSPDFQSVAFTRSDGSYGILDGPFGN